MPLLTRLIGLACCLTLVSVHASELTVATEGAYPPFSYFDANGKLAGFDVDIAQALCETMQTDCEIKAVPWVELLDRMEAGELDMIVASMAKTRERSERVDFTRHYYRSHSIFAGDPKRFSKTTPEALTGTRLATGRNTIQSTFLEQQYTQSEIVLTSDQTEALELLKEDKVDLVLSDTINLLDFLQTPEGARFDFVGGPLSAKALKSEAHIAVPKGRDALREKVNSALEQIRLDGSYDRINRKYFPFSIY
jgi:polar amino acid transport system substrate-binding protein